MPGGVVEQVVEHPAHMVARGQYADLRHVGLDRDGPVLASYGSKHDGGEGCGDRSVGGGVPVEPGEHEQALHQPRHPDDLGAEVLRRLRVLAEVLGHVELGEHRGKRAAQLMRCVGHERALPCPRGAEPVEHGVQRQGEVVDLVARLRHREPVVLAGIGDALRRRPQLLDGSERGRDHARGDQGQDDEQERVRREQGPAQHPLAVPDVLEPVGDHDRARCVGRSRPDGRDPQWRVAPDPRTGYLGMRTGHRRGELGGEEQRVEPVGVDGRADHPAGGVEHLHDLLTGDRDRVGQLAGVDQCSDLGGRGRGRAVEGAEGDDIQHGVQRDAADGQCGGQTQDADEQQARTQAESQPPLPHGASR